MMAFASMWLPRAFRLPIGGLSLRRRAQTVGVRHMRSTYPDYSAALLWWTTAPPSLSVVDGLDHPISSQQPLPLCIFEPIRCYVGARREGFAKGLQ